MANCSVPVHVASELVTAFQEFQRGKSDVKFMSFRLCGKDLSTLELADSAADSSTHDEFVERTMVADEPRFNFLKFAYDLGDDGKRVKTVLVMWVPPKCSIRAKLLSAAARSVVKKSLGFGYGIEVFAGDKGEAAEEAVLAKCLAVTH